MNEAVTVLKELDEMVWQRADGYEATLSEEITKTETRAEPAQYHIAGFRVFTGNHSPQAPSSLQARRKQLSNFRNTANFTREMLEESGLPIIAVLPEKIWEVLCDRARLFRFEHIDEKSRVPAANPLNADRYYILASMIFQSVLSVLAAVLGLMSKPIVLMIATLAMTIGGLVTWLGFFPNLHAKVDSFTSTGKGTFVTIACAGVPTGAALVACMVMDGMSLLLSPLAFLVASLVIGFFCGLTVIMPFESNDAHLSWVVRAIFRIWPKSLLYADLWPIRTDTPDKNILRVHISFPDPPADIRDILIKAKDAGYDLCTAAERKAIHVDLDRLADAVSEELKKDPIVYIKMDGVVAVIAQFGDFPLERRVIEEISGVDFLSPPN